MQRYHAEASSGARLTLGCVGVGPQGTYVMRNFLAQDDCQVVAICDLKKPRRDAVSALVNKHYGNDDANRRLVRAMRRPWRL